MHGIDDNSKRMEGIPTNSFLIITHTRWFIQIFCLKILTKSPKSVAQSSSTTVPRILINVVSNIINYQFLKKISQSLKFLTGTIPSYHIFPATRLIVSFSSHFHHFHFFHTENIPKIVCICMNWINNLHITKLHK